MSTNLSVLQRFVDAVNAGDIDVLDGLLGADVVDHHLPPEIPAGLAGVKLWARMLVGALELQVRIIDVVEDGDRTALRAAISGTHNGEFAGMPATGRSFAAEMMSIERFAGAASSNGGRSPTTHR
jgi:predicted ester cyclase